MNHHMHAPMQISTRISLGTAVVMLTLFIAGCVSNSPVPSSNVATDPPARPLQVCNAAPVQIYIGHNTVPSTLETIRQKSGAYQLRVLREGQPTTREFNQERLNVTTNQAGKIKALHCG